MRRATVLALLVGLLLALVAGPGLAQDADGSGDVEPGDAGTADAQEEAEDDTGACDLLSGTARLACEAVGGTVGSGVERAVTSSAESALSAVVDFVVDGAAWLLGEVAEAIETSTTPRLTADWFQGAYEDMVLIAALGLLPFLLLAIIQALIRQSVGTLVRAAALVPVAALGTGAAIVVVDMLVAITDNLSAWIGRGIEGDVSAFASDLGEQVLLLSSGTGGMAAGFAALLGALLIAFASFVIWLELLLRQAAIYVAVLFLPLGFMAMVWPATAHWLKRLAQGLVAIILSKFVIVAVMALAASALNVSETGGGEGGFGVVIAGASMLCLAALAPYVLLRLIPVFDAGDTASLEGTYRRPTAAVGSPAQGRGGQVGRLMRQRASGAASAGAAGMRAAPAAAGGAAAGAGTAGLATAAAGAKAGTQTATRTASQTAAQATAPAQGQTAATSSGGGARSAPTAPRGGQAQGRRPPSGPSSTSRPVNGRQEGRGG